MLYEQWLVYSKIAQSNKAIAHLTHLLGSKSAAFLISMCAFVAFPILSWNQWIITDKNKLRFQIETADYNG